MILKVDHEEIRNLLIEINRKLLLLENMDAGFRKSLLDDLLENEESELKKLAKILKVKI